MKAKGQFFKANTPSKPKIGTELHLLNGSLDNSLLSSQTSFDNRQNSNILLGTISSIHNSKIISNHTASDSIKDQQLFPGLGETESEEEEVFLKNLDILSPPN
jgi:hypothetical protein